METDSASPSGYDDSAVRIEGPPFGIDLLHHGLEHDLMMMNLDGVCGAGRCRQLPLHVLYLVWLP